MHSATNAAEKRKSSGFEKKDCSGKYCEKREGGIGKDKDRMLLSTHTHTHTHTLNRNTKIMDKQTKAIVN